MKINRNVGILLVFLLALSLIVGGCGQAAEKATEKVLEEAIENESGEKVDLDVDNESVEIKTDQGSLKVGSTYDWPSGMPSDVPEFKYGSIIGVIESNSDAGKSYTVTLENIEADAFEKYKSALEDNGWTIQYTQQMGTGWSLNAVKGNNGVSVIVSEDTTGVVSFIPQMQ